MSFWLKRGTWLSLLVLMVSILLISCRQPHTFAGTAFEDPPVAFAFEGTNYDGTPFRMSDQQGKVVLLFFGYTSCPDICPLTLAEFKQLATQLGERAEDVAFVFVTVDPQRDTQEKMASYVSAFDPSFYGVRLEGEMYEGTKKGYGVYVEKRSAENGDPNSYLVDHTGGIYVVDKVGNLSETFSYDTGAAAMLPDIEYWLEQ